MKKNGGGILMGIKNKLLSGEHRLLHWANRRPRHAGWNTWLGRWLGTITHTGGATFTLVSALLIALCGQGPWKTAGWQCLAAVALSHVPVAIVKRWFKRPRPYQALPHLNLGHHLLRDASFPSGHTTAVFAWLVPLLLADAALLPILLPAGLAVGLSVAWSRMYFGLHYPSDVIVGGLLGTMTALGVSYVGWL